MRAPSTCHAHNFLCARRRIFEKNTIDEPVRAATRGGKWEFVMSDADQGMWTYLTYVRRYFRVVKPRVLPSSHFWGGNKPFSHKGCAAYAEHVRRALGHDHPCVAQLPAETTRNCWWKHDAPLVRKRRG
jgi:hypothetical protein